MSKPVPQQQQQQGGIQPFVIPDVVLAAFPDAAQQAALRQLVGAMNNYSFGIVDKLLTAQEEDFNSRFAPLESSVQTSDTERFWGELATAYPELKDHMDIVRQLRPNFQTNDQTTRADLLKAFADNARTHLGKLVPTLAPQGEGQPGTNPPQTPPANGAPTKAPTPSNPAHAPVTSPTRPTPSATPQAPVAPGTTQTLDASKIADLIGG